MGQRGLEQLLGMDGKVEVERLAYVEAERCRRTTKCTLQCLFSLAFFQALFTHKCVYTGKTGSLKSGCARYCNATVKVSGVAGPSSRPAGLMQTPAALGSAEATLSGPRVCAVTGCLWDLGHVFLQGK